MHILFIHENYYYFQLIHAVLHMFPGVPVLFTAVGAGVWPNDYGAGER